MLIESDLNLQCAALPYMKSIKPEKKSGMRLVTV